MTEELYTKDEMTPAANKIFGDLHAARFRIGDVLKDRSRSEMDRFKSLQETCEHINGLMEPIFSDNHNFTPREVSELKGVFTSVLYGISRDIRDAPPHFKG